MTAERDGSPTCGRCGALVGDAQVHGTWHLAEDKRVRRTALTEREVLGVRTFFTTGDSGR